MDQRWSLFNSRITFDLYLDFYPMIFIKREVCRFIVIFDFWVNSGPVTGWTRVNLSRLGHRHCTPRVNKGRTIHVARRMLDERSAARIFQKYAGMYGSRKVSHRERSTACASSRQETIGCSDIESSRSPRGTDVASLRIKDCKTFGYWRDEGIL